MEMYSEMRAGSYSGDVAELARRHSDKFIPIPLGSADVDKYFMLLKEDVNSYVLMISNSNARDDPEHNIRMSVFGTNEERVKQLMQDFEGDIGIKTEPVPEYLQEEIEKSKALFRQLFQ